HGEHADDRQRHRRGAGPADLRRARRRADPGAAGAADHPDPLLPAQHEPRGGTGGAMSTSATAAPPQPPATAPARKAGNPLLRAISNPWGETRFLWVLAIGYVAWSLVPVVIAVVFSFNSARSLTQWGGFSLRWYITDPNNSVLHDPNLRHAIVQSLKLAT